MRVGANVSRPYTPVDFDPFGESGEVTTLPLSEAQQEMWTACAMGAEASCSYNQCFPVRFAGALSVPSLAEALRRLVQRYAALRAVFHPDAEHQTVRAEAPVALPVVDLSGLGDPPRRAEIARLIDLETHEPFDLEHGPLLRATLIREAPDRHLMILTAHHIVCDGWSAGIVIRDLGTLYGAVRHGVEPQLPQPARYEDYVRARAAGDPGEDARDTLAWWAARFADPAPPLDFPLDRPRPAAKSYHARQITSQLDLELCREIRKVGARHGATFFATLLAAFEVLVHRLTAQTDFVVGIPVAGQASIEDGDLVGHCVNTLPLRVAIDPAASFAAHLKSARTALVAAQDHSELTFGSLIRRLNLPRDPRRTPLVEATFNVDRVGAPPPFAGLSVELLPPPKSFVNFDMELNLVDDGQGIRVECTFSTALFDDETIHRWLGHYETLLRAIAADAEASVAGLPLMGDEDRRILAAWNDTKAGYPAGTLVHELFEAQAARTPARVAVSASGAELTYAELEASANRIAQALRLCGATRGQRVGLCLERGADMLAAVLGILKAGAAYVPLDPSFPAARLRFMADDARLAVLVTTAALAETLAPAQGPRLLLDADGGAIASGPATRLPADASSAKPEDPAYVIYTSGSTGKPKGVVVPHRAVVNFLTSMAGSPGLSADDVLVAVTTLSFDIAVLELQLPLAVGATVVIASRDEALDAQALRSVLARHGATVMQATPVTWSMLLAAGWSGGPRFKALVGGETLPKELAAQLRSRGVELWNMYGPTETTVWSTCARIVDASGEIRIGRPIANTTVYILDGQRELLPIGVPGELAIGGAGVTLGYWNRPELTAERFIPDPHSAEPGARLYLTGDQARWRSDGTLEHLGRLDLQLKLRGYRIEPGEIEAEIAKHPAVRQAVVAASGNAEGAGRLVAYLVVDTPPEDLAQQLRTLLRVSLPDYMIPSHFIAIDALPLTPNGKVDRRRLPDPGHVAVSRPSYAPPRTPVEKTTAGIWASVLGVERVGVDDDFFEMGGHSVQAAQIMTRLRAAFPLHLPLALLFQSPTVASLAAAIDALSWAAQAASAPVSGGRREEFEI